MEDTDIKKKRSCGRLPKHIKKTKLPKDPWKEYRPQQGIWECENCKFNIKRDPDIKQLDFLCPLCRGKFIRTSTIGIDPDTEYGWLLFLDSRKGEGREQFLEVQSILLERESVNGGWVSYSVIEEEVKKRCSISKTQLNRLMTDMIKYHIVTKEKKKDTSVSTINKNRIFFRYNSLATVRTLTKEGYKKEYSRLFSQNIDLAHHLIHATSVLSRHGLLQEYYEDLKKWDERKTPSKN